jgi:NitT/TauT family transport system substrate-binding protein
MVAVGGRGAFYYLPLTIAAELGFFKSEGVEVDIVDYPGGAVAQQAVLAGQADVVGGAYEHTIYLQSKTQLYQSFVVIGRAPAIALAVSNKALPNYRSVMDLRGKRIGVTMPGSSTQLLAALVLKRGGLSPDEAGFVGVGTSAGAVAALRNGQVDAISNVDPVMTMLEQKSEVRVVADTRTLKGALDVYGGPMPGGCLFAPQGFVRQNPGTVQALANGVVRALKWLQTAGPGDLIKAVPESYLLGDRGLYLASFNKVRESFSVDGVMAEESARTALRVLSTVDATVQASRITLAKTFSNDFVRRAKDKFKA